MLEKLVTKNAKLVATNKELVAIVQDCQKKKDLQRETYRLKKTGGSGETQGNRDLTLCPYFKKEGYHATDACFKIVKNKDKPPPGWKIWL